MLKNICIMVIFVLSAVSCTRSSGEKSVPIPASSVRLGAQPIAILQTGAQPLWFQLTENGPLLIVSIEDAINSAALIPWPLALHVRFVHEEGEELTMAVNRDGFMKIAPNGGEVPGLAMYRFSGGDFWRQYTIGGFALYNENPLVVLYLDDRFLDSASPLPLPRAWTFNMDSDWPFPVDIPAFQRFPTGEGWDIDTLRSSGDGLIYYRAARRRGSQPEIRMLRTNDLSQAGEDISLEVFYNSAPRETEISHPLLPSLPKGFFYTGIANAGDSLFASWEEQEEFNIGAAGFVVVKK
jgi:hypothetical protein